MREEQDGEYGLLMMCAGVDMHLGNPLIALRPDQLRLNQILLFNAAENCIDSVVLLDEQNPFSWHRSALYSPNVVEIFSLEEPICLESAVSMYEILRLTPSGGMLLDHEVVTVDIALLMELTERDDADLSRWLASELIDELILNRRVPMVQSSLSLFIKPIILTKLPERWLRSVPEIDQHAMLHLLNSAYASKSRQRVL